MNLWYIYSLVLVIASDIDLNYFVLIWAVLKWRYKWVMKPFKEVNFNVVFWQTANAKWAQRPCSNFAKVYMISVIYHPWNASESVSKFAYKAQHVFTCDWSLDYEHILFTNIKCDMKKGWIKHILCITISCNCKMYIVLEDLQRSIAVTQLDSTTTLVHRWRLTQTSSSNLYNRL